MPGGPLLAAAPTPAQLGDVAAEFTLKTARIILVHHSAAITEVYAERDEQEAIEAIQKVG